MTAPIHATFGTLCYFIVAACLRWAVSPVVSAVLLGGSLLPDIDIPTAAKDGLIIGGAGAVVVMVIQFFMRKAK